MRAWIAPDPRTPKSPRSPRSPRTPGPAGLAAPPRATRTRQARRVSGFRRGLPGSPRRPRRAIASRASLDRSGSAGASPDGASPGGACSGGARPAGASRRDRPARVARGRPAAAPEKPADGGDRDGQRGGERHREEAVGDPLRRGDGQRRLGRIGGVVEYDPADQGGHQIGEHRDGEDHPAGPGPDGQRGGHRAGHHEESEQETRRAPGHHSGDGADGRAGDDDADPEAALQRAPLS